MTNVFKRSHTMLLKGIANFLFHELLGEINLPMIPPSNVKQVAFGTLRIWKIFSMLL